MGVAIFSSTSARTLNAFNSVSWMSPIQSAFAFFLPAQIQVHTEPNGRANRAEERSQLATRKMTGLLKRQSFERAPAAHSEQLAQRHASAARCSHAGSLKILREFEPGKSRSSTGRLVISGRMADVCAALDRMASQGTSTH